MPFRKQINWGEALLLEVHYADGGLKGAVDRIHACWGASIGTRNTFATLYEMKKPPTEGVALERAWLLLLALGQDPAEWGIDKESLPKTMRDLDVLALRCFLSPAVSLAA